ncbi:3-oxoacyl-ACP reductase FabG [bacterium]|nr:3-oxoacyl-ACP reductase FabG [bacterium]
MSNQVWGLNGKSVLVTGASRGIGRSIAIALGEAGANVSLTYTGSSENSEKNAREVCELVEKAGGKALALALDLSNTEQIKDTVDQAFKHFGGLDGLVNNAGIVIDQLALRYKEDDFSKLMDVNVKGTFFVCKAALRYLGKSGMGSIVNMSSVVALSGSAGQAPYAASKAAIIAMSKSLAREMAPRNLRVNVIAPGYIDTDMTSFMEEGQKEALLERIPLKRVGKPEDIANGVLYLLSPLSSYVSGQLLNINGGLYM